MTRTIRLALVVLSGLAACTVNPNNIKPTVGDLCREAGSVMADRTWGCLGWDPTFARWAVPLALDFNCVKWGQSVSAGRMGYDEAAGVQCISDLRSMSCDQIFGGSGSGPPGACAQAIWGQVPAGYACTIEMDCARGTYCDNSATCGGICRAYANQGQICYDSGGGTWTRCSQGLNCMPDPAPSTNYHCQAPILAGNACPNAWGCADGLYCDTSSGVPASYVCKADPTSGQACGNGWACAGGLYCDSTITPSTCKTIPTSGQPCGNGWVCADGLYCNSVSTSCQPKKTSGPCGQWDACLAPLYVCTGDSPTWASPGTCRALAQEGQYCVNGWNYCAFGAYCNTGSTTPALGVPGVCKAFPGAGGPCAYYGVEYIFACIDSYCSGSPSGTCTPYVALGGSCTDSYQCGPDNYCTAVAPNVCAATCP